MPLQNYNKKHLHFDFKSFTPKNDYSNRPTSILKNSTHYQRNRDEDMEEESSNEESQQYEEEEEEFGDSNEYEFNEDYYDCCEKLTKPTSGIAYIQWKKKQDLLRGARNAILENLEMQRDSTTHFVILGFHLQANKKKLHANQIRILFRRSK